MNHLYFKTALVVTLSFLSSHLFAAYEINGIYYNLNVNEGTAEVTENPTYYSGDIVIPNEVKYEGRIYAVTSIGYNAFSFCYYLTSIVIPNSVTNIYECNPFEACSRLTSIVVEKDNAVYDSRDNCNAIIETATNTLITACPSTVIPNSVTAIGFAAFRHFSHLTSITIPVNVTSIGIEAFACTSLTSIFIPTSVTNLGDGAFYGCDKLTTIYIPYSVKTMGDNPFGGCRELTSIVVDSDNTVYDSRDNCNAIIETATNTLIGGCQNTVIPNSVTKIGYNAFDKCTKLKSIVIPVNVESIEAYAFFECSNLTSITITNPSKLKHIGEHAFNSTAWFDNQSDGVVYIGFVACAYKGTMPENCSIVLKEGTLGIADCAFEIYYNGSENLTSIELPSSLENIGVLAFYCCNKLASIVIPQNVTIIGERAFSGCGNLTSIVVDNGNSVYDSRDNCNAIIETATNTLIKGCRNTVIPTSIIYIEEDAFYGCEGLTSISVPNNVTEIRRLAFSWCI